MISIYKESVELTSVHLIEGCGKTLTKINDTIPHTRIDMGYRGTQKVPVHRYLYEVSVVPYRPLVKKTTTFSIKDLRKTLSQICIARWQSQMTRQISQKFFKRTTLTKGVLQGIK